MSEMTPLQCIEAMEANAFRVGQVARRLIADHGDLIERLRPYAFPTGGQLELSVRTVEDAAALATALQIVLDRQVYDRGPAGLGCFLAVDGKREINGVTVSVLATRDASPEELDENDTTSTTDEAPGGGDR